MNTQEYISSGIIEAYVTGIASDAEARELEQLAAQYPEIALALDEASGLMEQYASAHAVPPPAGIRQKILAQINDAAPEQETAPLITSSAPPAGRNPQIPLSTTGFWKYATAASIALLIASGIGNMYLMNRSKDAEGRVTAMKEEQDRMMLEKNVALQQEQKSIASLKTMVSPNTQRIVLAGVNNHTNEKIMLYWNNASGEVFVSAAGLPEPPYGKQYQLWAIVDGKPVNAGMIAPGGSLDLLRMETIPKAEMFAITMEHVGGSPVPTLDQMVVAGKPS